MRDNASNKVRKFLHNVNGTIYDSIHVKCSKEVPDFAKNIKMPHKNGKIFFSSPLSKNITD